MRAASESAATVFVTAAACGRLDYVMSMWGRGGVSSIDALRDDGWTALLAAVWQGHVAIAQFLLEHGASTESRTPQSYTSLHLAAATGNVDMLLLLCHFGADVDARGLHGKTALHLAHAAAFAPVASCLLNHGASVDEIDIEGNTALLQACWAGEHNRVVDLLRTLDQVKKTETKRALVNKPHPQDGSTALHVAGRRRDVALVKILVRHGADVEAKNADGFAPLHVAAMEGHAEMVQFLLISGADTETTTQSAANTPLMVASQQGFRQIVELLLNHGAHVNHQDVNGFSALLRAAIEGHDDIATLLLKNQANPEIRHNTGWTPLLAAIERQHLKVVQSLIDHGAAVNFQCEDFEPPLTIAVRTGNVAVSEALLKGGASTESRNKQSSTPLHIAAAMGNVEMIDLLCRYDADVDAPALYERTALHLALEGTLTRAALSLLTHGASAMLGDREGLTALMLACLKGDEHLVVQIVKRLDEAGKTEAKRELVNRQRDLDKWSPLHAAADLGHLSLVKFLVRHGADLETKNANEYSPLNTATKLGHEDVVEFLLLSGANKETTEVGESTPLVIASNRGFRSIVVMLLERSANIEHRDIHGTTAIFNAALWGRTVIVQLLLEHGADQYVRSIEGWTPLMAAAQCGHLDVARLLIKEGADVDCQCYNHWTPLTIAARNNRVSVCELLLERGASTTFQTTDGQTALHLAAFCDHKKIVSLLVAHGADRCACDFDGRTAAQIAMMEGYFETAERLKHTTEVITSGDEMWPEHCLRELYGLHDTRQRGAKKRMENPPWYIDRSSITSIEPCLHLSKFTAGVSVGTWMGSRVVIIEPQMIALSMGFRSEVKKTMQRQFREEVSKLYPLRHPHVIKLYGACHRGSEPFLVMEHPQENGTLRLFARENKHRTWAILHEVALGLQYLHERGIVHGDLMGDNILVGTDGLIKLAGFGPSTRSLNSELSSVWNAPPPAAAQNSVFDRDMYARSRPILKAVSAKLPHARSIKSDFTRVWEAPEVVLGQKATFESDIHALGMCIVESVSGESPYAFEESEKQDIKELVIGGVPPRRPDAFTSRAWALVLDMTCFQPHKRLNISDVVRELTALAQEEALEARGMAVDDNGAASAVGNNIDIDMKLALAESLLNGGQTGELDHDRWTPQQQVLRRLHDVWLRSHTTPPSSLQFVLPHLQGIVTRFVADLQSQSKVEAAASFAAQRQRAQRTFSLHNEIDRLMDKHDAGMRVLGAVAPIVATHLWRERWYRHRRLQLQAFGSSLDNITTLDADTATCLLFELTKRRDAYTSIPSADIHASCVTLRSMPGVRLPDWFIPDYEVAFDAYQSFSRGAFGSVHHGEWMGSRAVIKKVFADDDAEFEKEVAIWSQLYHPHVLQLFGACHVGEKFLVSEFASLGQLDRYLRGLKNQPVRRTREVWRTLYEAALGLQYLHARGIVHCDLKCNNILIGRDGKAKVSDYGLSRQQQHQHQELTPVHDAEPVVVEDDDIGTNKTQTTANVKPTGVGAPRWKAPEVINGAEPTQESDIYAFGMCIVEAVTGEYPWGMDDPDELVSDHVRRGGALFEKPQSFSEAQWALVVGACRFDPTKRLSLSEIVTQLRAFVSEESDHESFKGGDATVARSSSSENVSAEPEPHKIATISNESAAFSAVAVPDFVNNQSAGWSA